MKTLLQTVAIFAAMLFIVLVRTACDSIEPDDGTAAVPENSTYQRSTVSNYGQVGKNSPLPDIEPLAIDNPYGADYTGSSISTIDSSAAYVSCVWRNSGTAAFVPVDSLNYHFIHICVASVDTLRQTTTVTWDYYKDYFRSTVQPGKTDRYDEDYEGLHVGYNVTMVEYNAAGKYRELSTQNNVTFFGFYWYKAADGYYYGRYDNSHLTPKIKNKLRRG